jgi:DHA2 family multidrug resistance protein
MSAAVAGAIPAPRTKASLRDWVAFIGGSLGAFMAVLDIQITNSSLADIQGTLGASLDEGSWISTGYLIAEIIVIPMTGWLGGVFGLRRYLVANAVLFLGFSVLCGTSTSLTQMILFRVGQGFTGGVLIPTAFTILLLRIPVAQRAIGSAIFGLTVTFAPAIGPTIGGWLTDTYSWHWIFYINLVPGAALVGMIWWGLDPEPMKLDRLARGDWGGILCMAVGLGCLEYVLEEGQRKDWFGDPVIVGCAVLAAVFLVAFLAIELQRREPFIDLRLLGRRSLGAACAVNFATGLALYGSIYILPLYLSRVQGYNAFQIGQVQMWMGLPQLVLLPFLPFFLKRFDSRLVLGFGVSLFAVSCLMNGFEMTADTGIDQLRWSQLVRALGQPFIISPLSQMATVGIGPAQAGAASALFNMMRNLGGSFGIAMLATAAEHREHWHFSAIAERISRNSLLLTERLAHMAQVVGPEQALARLAAQVRMQATVMAYADCFLLIGAGLLVSLVGVAFLARAQPGGGGGGGH